MTDDPTGPFPGVHPLADPPRHAARGPGACAESPRRRARRLREAQDEREQAFTPPTASPAPPAPSPAPPTASLTMLDAPSWMRAADGAPESTRVIRWTPPVPAPAAPPAQQLRPRPAGPAGDTGRTTGDTGRTRTAPAPTSRRARVGHSPRTTAPRRPGTSPTTSLPWHLQRRFLLPVAGVCLLGSTACLGLLGMTAYHYAHGAPAAEAMHDVVLSATDSRAATATATPSAGSASGAATLRSATGGAGPAAAHGSTAAGTQASVAAADSGAVSAPTAAPTPGSTAATGSAKSAAASAPVPAARSTAAAPAATAPASKEVSGDLVYEGFGTARGTVVNYTVDGQVEGDDTLGATFALPQPGSAGWKQWYVSVTGTGDGSVGCRIRSADGAVLVEHTTTTAGDTVECAWGDQDAASTGDDPDDGDDG